MSGALATEVTDDPQTGPTRRAIPAALTALGVLAAVASVQLGLGSASQPGSGAWPLVASSGVVLSGAWLTITGMERPESVAVGNLARVLAAVATMALFVVLLPLVGMPLPALVAIIAWLRLFGESWRLTLVTAVLAVVALQIIFIELLAVPLPVGPLAPGR